MSLHPLTSVAESPNPQRRSTSFQLLAATLLFLASGYLALAGLGGPAFWDDEAGTALVAKNYLSTGRLTAWDGRNLYAHAQGTVLSHELMVLDPPLPFLATALSFRLLGVSTWAARLPFAVAGLAALLVFALILKETLGSDSWMWVYALGVLALSVPFLLYIRQCRYYGMALLFSSLAYLAYRKCLSSRHVGWFLLLSLSAVALFFSHYLVGGAFLASLGLVHLLFHRSVFGLREWAKTALAFSFFALATVPYSLSHRVWSRPDLLAGLSPEPLLQGVKQMSVVPWTVPVLLILLLVLRGEPKPFRMALEWTVLGLGNIALVVLISSEPVASTAPTATGRYLIASLPYFVALGGVLAWLLHRWRWTAGLMAAVLLVASNAASLNLHNRELRWALPAFLGEVHGDYPTSVAAVSEYLKEHARRDDLVFVAPEYFNWPLTFYAGERLRLCCFLDERSPLSKEALSGLDAPLFRGEHSPEWVVVFGLRRETPELLQSFSRRPGAEGEKAASDYRLVERLQVYWAQTQRPELPWHSFGPKRDFDPKTEGVFIYRRGG